MLEVLHIQNYALIDDLEVVFGPGFNVLTGETGAGKSIVVGALNLVLGARASADAVREGAKLAKVDAAFRLQNVSLRLRALFKQHDIESAGGEVLLSRVVTAEGRSRGYVCGSLVPIAVLAAVGDELVDIHGQHEHQSLLKPDRQLGLLDAFAGSAGLAQDLGGQVAEFRALKKDIEAIESDDRERARRIDFLRHEVGEIEAAGLVQGEEEELKGRRNLVANAERVLALANHLRGVLYEGEEGAAVNAIDSAAADLDELAGIDPRFAQLSAQLADARAIIEEVADEARHYGDSLEFDANELDQLSERLALIGDLKRKFGGSIAEIIEYAQKAKEEIEAHETRDQRLADMIARRDQILSDAQDKAKRLSTKRKRAARKLTKHVTEALQELGMTGGSFETAFESIALSLTGADRLEFLLTANPGESPKALRQVASGGEISRIMLALKAVFAHGDSIPTLIFDEIDAGVGGEIARGVAGKLEQLAASHQVICITHLAQIAAVGRQHYHVSKTAGHSRAITNVVSVEGDARIEEIARLLDGSVSEVSLEHARVLLDEMNGERP
ncbi:MAG: DNA repair protein RecN [Nitrospiraceae bacterium]|nr:DNA repair protein RecN [Nitrospiraceae bacterium]